MKYSLGILLFDWLTLAFLFPDIQQSRKKIKRFITHVIAYFSQASNRLFGVT